MKQDNTIQVNFIINPYLIVFILVAIAVLILPIWPISKQTTIDHTTLQDKNKTMSAVTVLLESNPLPFVKSKNYISDVEMTENILKIIRETEEEMKAISIANHQRGINNIAQSFVLSKSNVGPPKLPADGVGVYTYVPASPLFH